MIFDWSYELHEGTDHGGSDEFPDPSGPFVSKDRAPGVLIMNDGSHSESISLCLRQSCS